MKLLKRIAILTLQCFWFLCIAIPILMYLERPPVTTYGKREIMNPGKKVAPGGVLMVSIAAPMSKDCDGEVERIITDSTGREYPFAREERPHREEYPVEITVPLGTYPGPAQYWARVYWSCNWIQRFFPRVVIQPPIEFEILPVEGQVPLSEQQGIYMLPPDPTSVAAGSAVQSRE